MLRRMFLAVAVLAGLLIASPARATVLTPGDSNIPADATVTATGATLASATFSGSHTTNGKLLSVSVTEWVIKDSTTGHLDFVYQVTNKPASTTIIEHLAVADFSGTLSATTPNVGYTPGVGLRKPITMDMSGDGSVISWDFTGKTGSVSNNIQPGQTSAKLIVQTNSDSYNLLGTVNVIDGQTITLTGLQPTPEPSTMALAGLGALGFVTYGLRRRKAQTA